MAWLASKLPRLLDTASKFALFSVSGFKDETFIKSKLVWNWHMQNLFWSLMNISAKFHKNWSVQSLAIPFQFGALFWDTMLFLCFFLVSCASLRWPHSVYQCRLNRVIVSYRRVQDVIIHQVVVHNGYRTRVADRRAIVRCRVDYYTQVRHTCNTVMMLRLPV